MVGAGGGSWGVSKLVAVAGTGNHPPECRHRQRRTQWQPGWWEYGFELLSKVGWQRVRNREVGVISVRAESWLVLGSRG